jgi:hypothetical protein
MRTGNSGRAVAESYFHGASAKEGRLIEAIGAELMEIAGGRIKEIRDYDRPLAARAA